MEEGEEEGEGDYGYICMTHPTSIYTKMSVRTVVSKFVRLASTSLVKPERMTSVDVLV